MRYLLIFLIIIVSSFSLAASDGKSGFQFERERRSVIIPIEVRNNLAVVPVFINDHGPFYFILDTGVRTSILTEPALAHMLGLDFDDYIYIYGLGGEGIVQAVLSTGVDISLPGIRGSNMNMIIIPEDLLKFSEVFGFPVYGILGYDFFREFPVEISYANQRMRVFRNPDYRIGRRSQVVPMQIVGGKPYIQVSLVGKNNDTLTTNLLLDLGASHPIYLNRNYIHMSDKTISSFLGKGVSGNLMGEIGRIKRFIIGDIEIDKPLVFYPDAEFLVFNEQEIHWEGLIGGAIINRFNIIIDYRSEHIVLRPGRHFSRPFRSGLSGIEIVARGDFLDQFIVHYVRPGSASYEAGILSGDQIIRLNHMRTHELNMEEILDEITSREGYSILMDIKRNDEILRKHFRLREDL